MTKWETITIQHEYINLKVSYLLSNLFNTSSLTFVLSIELNKLVMALNLYN